MHSHHKFIVRLCRALQIPAWRRSGGGRLPQAHAQVELHMPKEDDPDREHRQEHREGSPAGGGERLSAAVEGDGGAGGLHEPRRHLEAARPLRDILGDQGRGGREGPGRVLQGDGRFV